MIEVMSAINPKAVNTAEALPIILEEFCSFNRQLGMVAQLRSERAR